jgi:hypothetical protein
MALSPSVSSLQPSEKAMLAEFEGVLSERHTILEKQTKAMPENQP